MTNQKPISMGLCRCTKQTGKAIFVIGSDALPRTGEWIIMGWLAEKKGWI